MQPPKTHFLALSSETKILKITHSVNSTYITLQNEFRHHVPTTRFYTQARGITAGPHYDQNPTKSLANTR